MKLQRRTLLKAGLTGQLFRMRRARQQHFVQGRARPNISWPSKCTLRGCVLDDEQRWRGPQTQRSARLHDAFPAGRPSAQPQRFLQIPSTCPPRARI
jgi:hypothetical protein